MRHVLLTALLLATLTACSGGGDDDDDVSADGGADASLVEYSEENCDTLFAAPQVPEMTCCYSGGYQAGCGEGFQATNVVDIDGVLGCVDQRVSEIFECAFFACETFVDDVSECE